MSISFLDLPFELWQPIIEHISNDWKALLQLSGTCKHLRSVLAPTAFRRLRLRNDSKSGESIRSIAKGLSAQYVEELHFQGFLQVDTQELVDDFNRYSRSEQFHISQHKRAAILAGDCPEPKFLRNDTNLLPSVVNKILRQLHLFPNLALVSVEFFFLLKIADGYARFYPEYEYGPQFFTKNRDPKITRMEKEESGYASRLLIKRTWDAITKNTYQIKKLEVHGAHILEISTCWTAGWTKFMNQVSCLTLTEGQNQKFIPNLSQLNVSKRQAPPPLAKSVDCATDIHKRNSVVQEEAPTFFRNSTGMFGQNLSHCSNWRLLNLRHLSLRDICLERGVFNVVLRGNLTNLETLSLHNIITCCSPGMVANHAMSWCELFWIIACKPTKLRSIEVSWSSNYLGIVSDDPLWHLRHIFWQSELRSRIDKASKLDLQEIEFDCGCIRWRVGPDFTRTTKGSLVTSAIEKLKSNLLIREDLASETSDSYPSEQLAPTPPSTSANPFSFRLLPKVLQSRNPVPSKQKQKLTEQYISKTFARSRSSCNPYSPDILGTGSVASSEAKDPITPLPTRTSCEPFVLQQWEPECKLLFEEHSTLHKIWAPILPWHSGDTQFEPCHQCMRIDPYPYGSSGCTFCT